MSFQYQPEHYRAVFLSLCTGNHGAEEIIAEGKVCPDDTESILACVQIVAFGMIKKEVLERGGATHRLGVEKTFHHILSLACCYCSMMIEEIVRDIEKFRTHHTGSILFGTDGIKLLCKFGIVNLILDKDPIVISFLREIPIWTCLLTREQVYNSLKCGEGEPLEPSYTKTIDLFNCVFKLINLINIANEINQ